MKKLRWQIAQFFELRWWKSYLGPKDPASYLDWKKNYWHRFLEQSGIQPVPGQHILDAGCGPAGIFTILDHLHPDALDPLLEEYEKTLPHFSKKDWPGTRFFDTDLESFSTTTQYDLIFCLNAINHVKDLSLAFDRLTALLRPGGTLAVSIDAHNHQWIKHVLRTIPGDILHPHQFDLPEYQLMLTRRGFRIDKCLLIKQERIFNYWLIVAKWCE